MYKRDINANLDRTSFAGEVAIHAFWITPSFQKRFNPENRTVYAVEQDVIELNNIEFVDNEPVFNGTDSYITLLEAHNYIESLNQRINYTFCCKFKLDDVSVDRCVLGANSGNHLTILYNSTTEKLDIKKGNTVIFSSATTINVDQKYFIALHRDTNLLIDGTNKQFLYIDGVLDASSTDSSAYEYTQPVTLGVGALGADPFSGMIDMPLFVSPHLNTDQLQQLMENPYSYLDFPADYAPSGIEATLSNATATATGSTTATGTVDTDTQDGVLISYTSTNITETDTNLILLNGKRQDVV